MRFLDALDHPQVGMILDIGHVRDARSLSDWRGSGRSDRTPYVRRGWAESDAARRRFRGGNDQNPMTRPGGPTEVVGICGHRLRHVHLHGFVDTDHYPPFHAGDRIQWVELFAVLKSVDYRGLINFEPSTSRARVGAIEAAGAFPERIVEMARERDAQTEGRPG